MLLRQIDAYLEHPRDSPRETSSIEPIRRFDKDNHGDIAIVAAATNISATEKPLISSHTCDATRFTFPREPVLAIKKIAGNIIPALASTNAIVAGLQVITAVKLLMMAGTDPVEKAREMKYSYLLKVKTNKVTILDVFEIGSVIAVGVPNAPLRELSHVQLPHACVHRARPPPSLLPRFSRRNREGGKTAGMTRRACCSSRRR